MNYIKEINKDFVHLLYYNTAKETHVSDVNTRALYQLVDSNINIFIPHYKRFKKIRNRNKVGFDVYVKLTNVIITALDNHFYKKHDYKQKRKRFKQIRNKLFKILTQKHTACNVCCSKENLSIDHIIPLIKGGTNDLHNLQILCVSCNSKKGKN